MPMTKSGSGSRLVVVTTDHKGVFFGLLNGSHSVTDTTAVLTDGQMCVYWSSNVKGVLGLAAKGPSRSCRVVPKIELSGVTAVMDATEEAAKAWRSQPWG